MTRAALPCLPDIDAIRCIISLVRSANYCLIDNILSLIEPLAKELSQDSNITNDYSKQAVLIEISNLLVSSGLRILNLCYENVSLLFQLLFYLYIFNLRSGCINLQFRLINQFQNDITLELISL